MKAVIKLESFKLLHRRETLIILSLFVLPFVLPAAFSLAPASYALNYSFGDLIPGSAYTVMGYAFWAVFGFFTLLFSILTASLSSNEIDSRYYYLYFPRVQKRISILAGKVVVLYTFAVSWYCVYTLLLNPLGHLMLIAVRPDMASGQWLDGSQLYWLCMWLIYLTELLLYVSLTLAIGLKFKSLAAIALVMAVFFGSMFLFDIPILRYGIPEFYKQRAISCVNAGETRELLLYTMAYIGYTLLLDTILFLLSKRLILKRDA